MDIRKKERVVEEWNGLLEGGEGSSPHPRGIYGTEDVTP